VPHLCLPLTEVGPGEMREILADEREAWARGLGWDFSATSGLIERSIDARAFSGFALREAGRVVAYAYFLPEPARSILGGVHAMPEAEGAASRLVSESFAHLVHVVGAVRIESQFLFFGSGDPGSAFATWGATRHPRQFLSVALDRLRQRIGPGATETLRPFRMSDRAAGAVVVHRSFAGALDAEMSECYRTVEGCEGFVEGALLRNGCGTFEPRASFLALADDKPLGLILTSRISATTAHVVQISVDPDAQGRGIGRSLMRAACDELWKRGLTHLSLSVSVGNVRARSWYLDLGFEPMKDFAAYVWTRS
jgi:ribosomal protein S18 acetylase RimI-like enzyme